MSKPDNELIAETLLFSEGYKDAKSLGRKLVAIFNLSRQVSSPRRSPRCNMNVTEQCIGTSGKSL